MPAGTCEGYEEQLIIEMDGVQVAVEYAAYHAKGGLTFEGLQQTYEDGIGDVDVDYETLGLDEPVSIFHMHTPIEQCWSDG